MGQFKYQQGEWIAQTKGDGKRIYIDGPSNLEIQIDFDDVNHDDVETDTKQLIDLLAEQWDT